LLAKPAQQSFWWRSLGPVENLIGMLMCGLSASFLFAIVTRLVARQAPFSREPAEPLSIAAGALRQALRWKSEPTGADGESDEDGPSPE
jgi:hypothetical protein